MKKMFVTATALMFALGLAVSAHAQGAVEKSKNAPAQVQKVMPQEQAQQNIKTDATKVTQVEGKKLDTTATDKKEADVKGKKDKDTAATKNPMQGVKTTAAEVKKPGPETPKTDKK